ncbi:MAG: hypothetical protein CMP62_03225 [Flavobacteriales bacterium]|nr:hypothetical protein [Flavobacteriales bacterium]|tara:strand:+ start:1989 stop:2585 length:597 start_codon:yes stop_codon:yes gene_type:complete
MKTLYLKISLLSGLLLFIGCPPDMISGCTDSLACNYNPNATDDDDSCNLPDGCMDVLACNYNASSICDDGSCLYEADALPNPIEITHVEEYVVGEVDSLLVSHIHVRNASCENMNNLVVRKIFNDNNASAYFCFNGICFTSETITSPNPLNLGPFEEDDYFKGYLTSDVPGIYSVTYRFYIQDNPSESTEVVIDYEVN